MSELQKVRVDKWLWAVRLYKSRTQAAEACDGGKVKIEGQSVKPSRMLSLHETVHVRLQHHTKIYKVTKLIEKRVSAALAAECFEDLSPVEDKSEMLNSVFKMPYLSRERGAGRPTKRDRRDMDRFVSDD